MKQFVNQIFTIIVDILPADWGKLAMHMSISQGVQSMFFFVKGVNQEKYFSYYDLQQMGLFSKEEYRDVRLAIGKQSFEYKKNTKESWTGYTLVIGRSGNVEIDFEYSEQPIDIPTLWKDKYLN